MKIRKGSKFIHYGEVFKVTSIKTIKRRMYTLKPIDKKENGTIQLCGCKEDICHMQRTK